MRTYQRKYLVVYAETPRESARIASTAMPDYQGILSLVTTCVEWLDEHFGWELVNIFTRECQGDYLQWHCYYAMLRRSRSD
ncbi:hypothetical protein AB0E01_17310 [Nocardia vinacea]|uniref:hypothetical protein n=1 Tax=Nocardia vinacea TaxID=96468 RepID=UPI0033D4842E